MTAPQIFSTPGLFDELGTGLQAGAGLAKTGAETQDIRSQSAFRQQMAGLEQAKMQMEQYKMQAAQEHAARLQQMGTDYVNDLTGATDDNSRADVTLRHAGKL